MSRRLGPMLMAVALLAGCERHSVGWDLQRMVDQPHYEPYERSAFFPDGKVMQGAPPGAIPRAAPGRFARLERPPVDLRLLERGRDRFLVYCAPCHGADGFARTQVAQRMTLRPPPSLHEPRIQALGVDHVQHVIETGYGLMPAYDALLESRDEWAIASFVQVLWLSQRAPLDALPADLRERALRSLEAAPGVAP